MNDADREFDAWVAFVCFFGRLHPHVDCCVCGWLVTLDNGNHVEMADGKAHRHCRQSVQP